jgi:hypothetical protein
VAEVAEVTVLFWAWESFRTEGLEGPAKEAFCSDVNSAGSSGRSLASFR